VSRHGGTAEDAVSGNVPEKAPAPQPLRMSIMEDNSTVTSTDRTPSDRLLDRVRSQVNGVPAADSSLPVGEISGDLGERNVSSIGTSDYNHSTVLIGTKDLKRLGKTGVPGVGEIQPSDGSASNSNTSQTGSRMAKGEESGKGEVVSNADTGKPRDPGQRMADSRLHPRMLEEDMPRNGGDDKTPEYHTEKEQQEISVDDHERRRLQFLVSTAALTRSTTTTHHRRTWFAHLG